MDGGRLKLSPGNMLYEKKLKNEYYKTLYRNPFGVVYVFDSLFLFSRQKTAICRRNFNTTGSVKNRR